MLYIRRMPCTKRNGEKYQNSRPNIIVAIYN
jgi:hypothetical protein